MLKIAILGELTVSGVFTREKVNPPTRVIPNPGNPIWHGYVACKRDVGIKRKYVSARVTLSLLKSP